MKTLKSIFLLIMVLLISVSLNSVNAATCQETNSANGQDDSPVSTIINSFPCVGAGTITAMTLDASIGSDCITWYDYDIYINGILQFSNQCDQTGLDISAFLPITSVELRSRDTDLWSDNITLALTLDITYSTGPMTYTSCTTTQNNTTDVTIGSTNQEIVGVEVVTDNSITPFDVTQLQMDIGTTNLADITGNINVYYTGTNSTFATTTLFGSIASATGTLSINGTQTLAEGTNYFWITYDIDPSATISNTVDAVCTQVTMNGGVGNQAPTTTSPVGSRSIIAVSYCASNATDNGDSEIDNVVLVGDINTISNNTASTCAQYSDFTGLTPAELTLGESYQADVTLGTCSGDYGKSGRVFIDWNRDGDFDDANEGLGEQGLTAPTTTCNFNFTVPAAATIGNTTMRVICKEGTGITSCGTYGYGETEDYTVTIVASGPMTYTSCTTTQNNTTNVLIGSANQEIIGVEIVTTGAPSPFDATQFQINMNGTTSTADVGNIDVYYTGTSGTFATTTLYGSVAAGGGILNVNGSQTLSSGTNYFWVVYDIAGGATVGNVVDAECTQITMDGGIGNQIPTTTSPAGSRTIIAAPPSPGGVSGLTVWFKANSSVYSDAGTTPATDGNPIQQWSELSGFGALTKVSQATVSKRPIYREAGINYNPVVSTEDLAAPHIMLSPSITDTDLSASGDLTFYGLHTQSDGVVGYLWNAQAESKYGFQTDIAFCQGDVSPDNTVFLGSALAPAVRAVEQTNATGVVKSYYNNNYIATATNDPLSIGNYIEPYSVGALPNEDWSGSFKIGEILYFDGVHSTLDRTKVSTYLAIKYGITIDNSGGGTQGDYIATDGTTIWDASVNAAYQNDIIGIGKDIAEELEQKQSHTLNDTTRLYLSSLETLNSANTGTFSNDGSYILLGNNQASVCQSTVAGLEKPSGIFYRLDREWKVSNTNMDDSYSIDVTLNNCANITSVSIANLRLLVDDDGDFTNASIYAAGGGLSFSYNNPIITISGISTANIPANSTKYITIASVDIITPLPIELLAFSAKCQDEVVALKWKTASELNNDFFVLQKSIDAINWERLTIISGSGNSSNIINYEYIDNSNSNRNIYYRLKQVDYDGSFSYSKIISLKCNSEIIDIVIYPNPAEDQLNISINNLETQILKFEIYNSIGQKILENKIISSHTVIDVSSVPKGIYVVVFELNNKPIIRQKLLIK